MVNKNNEIEKDETIQDLVDNCIKEVDKEELQYLMDKAKLKWIEKGIQSKQKDVLKMIDNIEIELPDEDGVPFEITAEDFKEELKQKIGEIK